MDTYLLREQEIFPGEEVLEKVLADSFPGYKKKTIFWLSVWDKYFKIAFYFIEKNSPGIAKLNIDKSILEDFSHAKPAGKLLPLVITFRKKSQIPDVLKIVEYKKSLK